MSAITRYLVVPVLVSMLGTVPAGAQSSRQYAPQQAVTTQPRLVLLAELPHEPWGKLTSSPQPQPSLDARTERAASSAKRPSDGRAPAAAVVARAARRPDLNGKLYYKNKREFSLEVGYLPINIPFVFDVFVGDYYWQMPRNYTLLPVMSTLRWQLDNVGGPFLLRGNWEASFSASVTAVPRGPENHYEAYIMGIRRNFVGRRLKVVPYFGGRLGMGIIDAKGPKGVPYAQGQNFTFTIILESGARYNINSRYSISAGVMYMHISNLYMSEPRYENWGINVYGPAIGINVRLGRLPRQVARRN